MSEKEAVARVDVLRRFDGHGCSIEGVHRCAPTSVRRFNQRRSIAKGRIRRPHDGHVTLKVNQAIAGSFGQGKVNNSRIRRSLRIYCVAGDCIDPLIGADGPEEVSIAIGRSLYYLQPDDTHCYGLPVGIPGVARRQAGL
jgi:hypothetical protein